MTLLSFMPRKSEEKKKSTLSTIPAVKIAPGKSLIFMAFLHMLARLIGNILMEIEFF